MPKQRLRHAFVAVMIMLAVLAQGTWALAGTTGGISGTLTDTSTGKAVAGAKITAVSPSQTATTTTDASGRFNFLALAPDTYTISAEKDGYAPQSIAGVTVFADQSFTIPLTTHPELKTIAVAHSRAAGNLVKPGTTSDVYSVNAATQQVVSGSGGGFNLNTAYSGIYSQPGVTSYIGNAGWGQVFYIRGASYGQTGYEFDGVPVNRAFDNYQANSLSSLGQQELQVYTGGSPSGASSATLGGFINQVIKTGTYPGFGTLKAGIGAPGFYHALTAEAGGANPNRTFSYYVGLQGYNQVFPAGDWKNLSGIASNGLNQYGLSSSAQISNWLGAVDGDINTGNLDLSGSGGNPEAFVNGPYAPCQTSGANAGEPIGFTAANPGPFNGACLGYYPFTTYLSEIFERDTVLNFHFGIPHKYDSGRDDLQLLYDNSMQQQMNGDSPNDAGGYNYINALLTPYNIYSTNNSSYAGLCGYENLWGAAFGKIGCAKGPYPTPYLDSLIWAPGTQFGQLASNSTAIPYYFPNSPTNRTLNAPCAFTSDNRITGNGRQHPSLAGTCNNSSGLPPTLRDAYNNDVGIVKAQYTKNLGSNAYARLFGYSFYSDWLIGGPQAASVCYLDGLNCGAWGSAGTADYELSTHTRGAELQLADQVNAQNLLRLTANYTTASVARWNNSGTWMDGYAGSRSAVTDWTNGDPNNPTCYRWSPSNSGSLASFGQPWSCDNSLAYGTMPFPGNTYAANGIVIKGTSGLAGPMPAQLSNPALCGTTAAPGAKAATPGCQSFLAGKSNWMVTTPSGQGTFNTVRPIFTSFALEDEFKPTDRWDLNLGVRFENYQYNLSNGNTPEMNFWFNAYASILCYDPGTGLPQFTPLAPGQPVPPSLVTTATPLGQCGTAPSGQEGLHPVGTGVTCDNVTTFDCGPLRYTAKGASTFTHGLVSPRIGGTYTMGPDDVLRFSVGKYTQPTETAFEQYLDQSGKRAANFDFSRFWGLGFHNPTHDNPVQYSNNYDFSIEHHFRNTDITAKVSPFYRDTHNQIETVVLGPGFVSGTNTGHQHSYGVEFALSKGDPTRDGWSGGISYTYTKALVQYGDLPNGTNSIDYLNNYIKAFNGLTQAGGGTQCYQANPNFGSGAANATTLPYLPDPGCAVIAADSTGGVTGATAANVIANPYYGMASQPLLDRKGWYQTYPNEAPNAPYDQGGSSAIWPHQFNGWFQWKRGKLAIAPNFTVQSGSYYGSPTDTYGIDPRACAQNEAAATDANGNPITVPAAQAGYCDFLTAGNTFATDSGYLAIPNPFTGKFDNVGQYQQPWQLNIGALVRYDISSKVTANLTLTNLYNACYGGTSTPWSKAFKPGKYVCGYGSANGQYIGPVSGQPGFGGGFFYGASPGAAVNGSQTYPASYNYPFAPFTGALPFQAYLELQIKM
jgi:hypothetical protein